MDNSICLCQLIFNSNICFPLSEYSNCSPFKNTLSPLISNIKQTVVDGFLCVCQHVCYWDLVAKGELTNKIFHKCHFQLLKTALLHKKISTFYIAWNSKTRHIYNTTVLVAQSPASFPSISRLAYWCLLFGNGTGSGLTGTRFTRRLLTLTRERLCKVYIQSS